MNRELAIWLYLRLSGIVLLFLVLGHMLLMHVLVGVNGISFGFVQARWSGLGWRAYDFSMLVLAMGHGALGLRGLAYEHVAARLRRSTLGGAYAFCFLVTGLGAWVILTFPSPV
jgi:succinate dehydrogenase / fumarate reductase membrane anchor subunit